MGRLSFKSMISYSGLRTLKSGWEICFWIRRVIANGLDKGPIPEVFSPTRAVNRALDRTRQRAAVNTMSAATSVPPQRGLKPTSILV
mmetsp:Transcript_30233/g.46295  ORF Transcript_30233/g.46295 Transcript_30233/m.46295 type:complete len:87 (+) Transcript_30233:562-822(+)